MTRHLAKLLDAIWTLSMGLFLGLTGGLVLAVILTFRGARAIDAKPGIEPYNDPQFAEYHNDAVAGYIGQDLFMVGGTVALVLLGIGMTALLIRFLLLRKQELFGCRLCQWTRAGLMVACSILMISAAANTLYMNKFWPTLYYPDETQDVLKDRRESFDNLHVGSERLTSAAWLSGFFALGISPWCRRLADGPSQPTPSSEQ